MALASNTDATAPITTANFTTTPNTTDTTTTTPATNTGDPAALPASLTTPRLRLTLVTTAPRGSDVHSWFHEIRSDVQATFWSLYGVSKSIEDTEKVIDGHLPLSAGAEGVYRVAYIVHRIIEPTPTTTSTSTTTNTDTDTSPLDTNPQTDFIGIVSLRSVGPGNLALPEHLVIPADPTNATLTIELAYLLMPRGWGAGYATEAVRAVLDACAGAPAFWKPYTKLYVRGLVNAENPASLRVMAKAGVPEKGVYHWKGEALYLGGKMRTEDYLHIFGRFLIE